MFGLSSKKASRDDEDDDDENSRRIKKKKKYSSSSNRNEEGSSKSSKKKKAASVTNSKRDKKRDSKNTQVVVRQPTRFNLLALVRKNPASKTGKAKKGKRGGLERSDSRSDIDSTTNHKVHNKKKMAAMGRIGARDSMVTIGGGARKAAPLKPPGVHDDSDDDDDDDHSNSGAAGGNRDHNVDDGGSGSSTEDSNRNRISYPPGTTSSSSNKKRLSDNRSRQSDEGYDTNSLSSDSNKRMQNANNPYVVDTLLNFGNNAAKSSKLNGKAMASSHNHGGVRFNGDSEDSFEDSNAKNSKTMHNNTNNNSHKQQMVNAKNNKKSVKKRISIMHDQWFNFLCHNTVFCKICDQVFDVVDVDHTGAVDENELYNGLLLIHLRLGIYFGSAACIRPVSREQCSSLFYKLDRDKLGIVDKIDFREIMIVLFGNVLLRVILQWMITLCIVPFIAQYFVKLLSYSYMIIMLIIGPIFRLFIRTKKVNMTGLMESYDANNMTEITNRTLMTTTTNTTSKLGMITGIMQFMIAIIPQKVFKTAPLVIVSSLLGMGVVPIIIYYIDGFFNVYADNRAKKPRSRP